MDWISPESLDRIASAPFAIAAWVTSRVNSTCASGLYPPCNRGCICSVSVTFMCLPANWYSSLRPAKLSFSHRPSTFLAPTLASTSSSRSGLLSAMMRRTCRTLRSTTTPFGLSPRHHPRTARLASLSSSTGHLRRVPPTYSTSLPTGPRSNAMAPWSNDRTSKKPSTSLDERRYQDPRSSSRLRPAPARPPSTLSSSLPPRPFRSRLTCLGCHPNTPPGGPGWRDRIDPLAALRVPAVTLADANSNVLPASPLLQIGWSSPISSSI